LDIKSKDDRGKIVTPDDESLYFQNSGPWGTVPELLFEKKGLIPAVQQLLVSHLWLQTRE
jgi:hypothetical protein